MSDQTLNQDTAANTARSQSTDWNDESLSYIIELAKAIRREARNLYHNNRYHNDLSTLSRMVEANGKIDFADKVRRFEMHLIERALQLSHGNQKLAAKMLSLETSTLSIKIKKYDLGKQRDRFRNQQNAD